MKNHVSFVFCFVSLATPIKKDGEKKLNENKEEAEMNLENDESQDKKITAKGKNSKLFLTQISHSSQFADYSRLSLSKHMSWNQRGLFIFFCAFRFNNGKILHRTEQSKVHSLKSEQFFNRTERKNLFRV